MEWLSVVIVAHWAVANQIAGKKSLDRLSTNQMAGFGGVSIQDGGLKNYCYQLSKARRSFGDELSALRLRCCHGQFFLCPMVAISSPTISRAWLLCRQRPTSCHWKRSQLPMTATEDER